MSTQYFHFTLGPVQGFVAQARRTRDFWAGSFILSWLSSVAMLAVTKQPGCEIKFPTPDQAFQAALETGGSGPKQGNVPNRFKAEVSDDFDPNLVVKAVNAAWQGLADHVWKKDLNGISEKHLLSHTIWNRQVAAFWEIQWALVDDNTNQEASTLDRLKNWRTHLPADEPGIKCMMMDGWQELSGATTPGKWNPKTHTPSGPSGFWQDVRNTDTSAIKSDLREGEMLCAMAFIKRRFARHFHSLSILIENQFTLKGWGLPKGVPSVHYLAAAHWLEKLILKANDKPTIEAKLSDFHDAAYKLTNEYGEWSSNVHCITQTKGKKQWQALNGEIFFDSMLENHRLWDDPEQAKELAQQLRTLNKDADLDPATPFYAVLLMDGDELGIHMSDVTKQPIITAALAQFTQGVSAIVETHSGFLVYAGGDDVLAILPIEDALPCAAELRKHYLSCFTSEEVPSTLSGAIEYAHAKIPLGKILADAHDLLDKLAKDTRGRDAIACRVWNPGGKAIEWAMPWQRALSEEKVTINILATTFREEMKNHDKNLSNKFFYRIRERFDLLNPPKDQEHLPAILNHQQALDLMAMEFLNSGAARNKEWTMDRARDALRPLLKQCRPVTRNKAEPKPEKWHTSNRLEADGALLVRFLAHKGLDT